MFLNHKNTKRSILALFLLGGIFVFVPSAHADLGTAMTDFVSMLLGLIISALGPILVLVIKGLIAIASYQDFISSRAVVVGWVIVRDLCNMFFVVVLMIIAFGTILNIPDYTYKKWLPKLILMAILINFSKTICGLLIDVAQVVMLTFVNAFKDIGGGNLTDILGIQDVITLAKNSQGADGWTIIGGYILGIIYLLVAIVVLVTMMMMLAMRLVMIWIYVVLSPAAYLLAAFPGGKNYSSQWWDEFIKNLIVGPVLAFFIWLSLAALSADSAVVQSLAGPAVAGTAASTPSALIKFVVAIGMLVGGLTIAQKIGGAAGSIAGKGMAKIQKGAAFAGGVATGIATGAALLPFKGASLGINYGVDKLQQKKGIDLNLKRAWGVMQAKRKEIKEKQYSEGQIAAGRAMESGGRIHGALAMTGNAGDAYEQVTSLKGIQKRLKGGKMLQRLKEEGVQDEKQAKTDKARYDFEEKWADTDPNARDANGVNERTKMVQGVENERDSIAQNIKGHRTEISKIDEQLAAEKEKDMRLQDKTKMENLEKEKVQHSANIDDLRKRGAELQPLKQFIDNVQKKGEERKVYTAEEKDEIKIARNEAVLQGAAAKEKIEKNTPDYNFEARAAEQHAVSQETAKIKDITDPQELLRILKDAITSKDKTMVKAITLKMTKDYNDNEFLKPLAGRTDHKGLKDLMHQLSTEGSENYAGFSEQEAFGLGSQIAELNKGTKHWDATAAYAMDNGQWRETTDQEHMEISLKESGKRQLEAQIREDNRLGYGYHDNKGDFNISPEGVMKLLSYDTDDGHKRFNTMNESAAGYLYEAIMKNEKLKNEFNVVRAKVFEGGKTMIQMLETRLGALAQKNMTGGMKDRYEHVTKVLGIS